MMVANRKAGNRNRWYFDPKTGARNGLFIQLLTPAQREDGWRVFQAPITALGGIVRTERMTKPETDLYSNDVFGRAVREAYDWRSYEYCRTPVMQAVYHNIHDFAYGAFGAASWWSDGKKTDGFRVTLCLAEDVVDRVRGNQHVRVN